MHLKNPLLFGLMAILLLGGTITPAISQSSFDSQIVINEVETNSAGSDKSEFVELYNPTTEEIDIGGWSLVPSATWKTYEIPIGTIIEPKSFVAFTHVNFWFKDFGEIIILRDSTGNLIDETPLIKDLEDNGNSWQRSTDGLDTNSISDWELKRMSPKSSNGIIIETQESIFSFNADIDKLDYGFGDQAIISGSISEQLFTKFSSPEIIKISIKGPNYFKNLAFFPDRDLNFSTTLNLQKVLGFNEGDYDVTITYGEYVENLVFAINSISSQTSSELETETLEIFTDKESYIPGETVLLSAETNSSITYAGLNYIVTDPNGKLSFEGTIFPNSEFSIVHQAGGGQIFPFSTQLMMSTVNTVYGVYEVEAVYKSLDPVQQNSKNMLLASTSFNLVEDIKEDVPISLSVEKQVYSVGDIIKVTGRSNDVFVETLNLKVTQTGVLSSNPDDIKGQYVRPDPFTLSESIRLNGDGTFEFEFQVTENYSDGVDFSYLYGDYKIEVSEYFGDASVFFNVTDDPESFVDVRTPLGLKTEKSEYVLGTALTFTGKILDYDPKGNQMLQSVELSFTDPDGNVLMSEDRRSKEQIGSNYEANSPNAKFTVRANPDSLGVYQMNLVLHPIQFDYGMYTATVSHPQSNITESLKFEIISAQSKIIPQTETLEPLTLKLCASDRLHVDEIIKDFKSIGKGEIAPSMESIDCSNENFYTVGQKLVVTGKVLPKNPTSLDQSSTKTSGQTQQGHSYSTNYAESIMNYVEVSIPYPKSMTVSGHSSVKTTPNEDENFTGGGGSGEGGSYYRDEDGNVIRNDVCEASSAGACVGTKRSDRSGEGSYDGKIILSNQKLLLTNMNFKAYPDEEGNFVGVFELRPGVFNDGVYLVRANYFGHNVEQLVTIEDNSLKGGLKPNAIIKLEKDEFLPGETVKISGKIQNIYYFDNVPVSVKHSDESNMNCMSMDCGMGNDARKLRVTEGVNGAEFFWNYKLPKDTALGLYTITADTHFGEFKKQFFVVDESEVIGTPVPETMPTVSKKIIEKFNRIADDKIPIILTEKSSDDSILAPRVIQGSLFTSARGEESDVNLRITTSSGQCVIGQSSDCLVTESTRKPGAIYSIVTIDDVNYKIRYSGDDVRLEKFSIVPENSTSKIDIDNWNVEILKDEQPSRFYYKVSYVALE